MPATHHGNACVGDSTCSQTYQFGSFPGAYVVLDNHRGGGKKEMLRTHRSMLLYFLNMLYILLFMCSINIFNKTLCSGPSKTSNYNKKIRMGFPCIFVYMWGHPDKTPCMLHSHAFSVHTNMWGKKGTSIIRSYIARVVTEYINVVEPGNRKLVYYRGNFLVIKRVTHILNVKCYGTLPVHIIPRRHWYIANSAKTCNSNVCPCHPLNHYTLILDTLTLIANIWCRSWSK